MKALLLLIQNFTGHLNIDELICQVGVSKQVITKNGWLPSITFINKNMYVRICLAKQSICGKEMVEHGYYCIDTLANINCLINQVVHLHIYKIVYNFEFIEFSSISLANNLHHTQYVLFLLVNIVHRYSLGWEMLYRPLQIWHTFKE